MSRTTDYYYPYLSKEDARTDSMLKGRCALERIADALERIADTLDRQRLTIEGIIPQNIRVKYSRHKTSELNIHD